MSFRLALAALQHRRSLRTLREQYVEMPIPYSLAQVVAVLVGGLGILGLLAVIFRQ